MARIRSIHPEQWTDDQFVSCSPLARLLALGIRNEADDNGIFEWNVIKLKMRLMPADNCDVPVLLNELQSTQQIIRYEVDGKAYGVIRSFQRFQRPKEPTFKHPLPPVSVSLPHGYSFHDKGPSRCVIPPEFPQGFGSPSPELPQDSRKVVSDGEEDGGKEVEESIKPTSDEVGSAQASPDLANPPAKIPDCPHQRILALYAKHLPNLPQPRVWEGQRAENLRARWRWALTAKRDNGERYATDLDGALDFFGRVFAYIAESDFLTGRSGKWHGCDLAWLVKAENFAKVIEGKYENRMQEGA